MRYAVSLRDQRGNEEIVYIEAEGGDDAAEAAFQPYCVILGVHPAPEEDAAEPVDETPVDPRVALRAEYETVVGKKAFNGWNEAALREKIEAAKAAATSN